MNIKVIASLVCLFFAAGAVTLSAEETWQGNAAVSMRGELDRDGYFAASNSFPPGTKIMVTNLENKKSVIVTIKQRLNGTTNVFLLLSPQAGLQLGMEPTDIIRIKTQVVGISTDLTGNVTDLADNRDADTNPSAGTPDDKSAVAQATPTPTPWPSPTPSPTPSPSPSPTPTPTPPVKDASVRVPEKDRYAPPVADQEAEVSVRRSPVRDGRESAGDVELKEARVPIKDKAEAVIITRPRREAAADATVASASHLPTVVQREIARADVHTYAAHQPDKEEVIAVLIEPKEIDKGAGEAVVTAYNRPTVDRETIEAVLADPQIMALDKPLVWERHGVRPEEETVALAEPALPDVGKSDVAAVDTYARTEQEKDRVALETHNLPDVQKGEKADVTALARTNPEGDKAAVADHKLPDVKDGEKPDVNALAKTDPEKDKAAVASHRLPDVKDREKPDVMQKADVEGKDKKSTDLALVPTDPRPPVKTKTDRTTTTTTTTTVQPDKTTTTTTTVWDPSADYMKNYYYLQLGVFTSKETAEKVIRANPAYPMVIVAGKAANADVYKVVVGPLKRDESGTALYLFRARGYRDAFLRFIE